MKKDTISKDSESRDSKEKDKDTRDSSSLTNSNSQRISSSINKNLEDQRKIKTANGTLKKHPSIVVPKNNTNVSSYYSNDIKEKDKLSKIGNSTFNKNYPVVLNPNSNSIGVKEYLQQGNQKKIISHSIITNDNGVLSSISKLSEKGDNYNNYKEKEGSKDLNKFKGLAELNEYMPNISSTTKNSKSKNISIFK